MAAHETELQYARTIAATGFATLSSLEAGFYGKGEKEEKQNKKENEQKGKKDRKKK